MRWSPHQTIGANAKVASKPFDIASIAIVPSSTLTGESFAIDFTCDVIREGCKSDYQFEASHKSIDSWLSAYGDRPRSGSAIVEE